MTAIRRLGDPAVNVGTRSAHNPPDSQRGAERVRVEPLLYSVREVADLLSVGRAKVYELLSAGKIESVKLDGSRRILRQSLEKYIERLRAEAGLF